MELLVQKLQPYLLWLRAYINSMTNAQLLRFIFWIVVAIMCIWIIDKNAKIRKKKKQAAQKKYETGWRWDKKRNLWVNDLICEKDTVGRKEPDKKDAQINYGSVYQQRAFLAPNDRREYVRLRAITDPMGLIVYPKVRAQEIVEARLGEYHEHFKERVLSKYVDFVITDTNWIIKALILLDDGSKERDDFLYQVLSSVGYKVIHTRSISQEALEGL